jgi:hypothetical protein
MNLLNVSTENDIAKDEKEKLEREKMTKEKKDYV